MITETSAASDAGTTVVVTEAELFEGLGSVSSADTLAVSVSGPAAFGVTTIVAVAVAPRPICPRRQVTVPPAGVHPGPERKVTVAGSGEEGLARARELRPDVITLDVAMPRMDGWSVLSALKADPDLVEIPVIMLTMVDNKSMGYALGAADYMMKPVNRTRFSISNSTRCL